MGPDINNFDGMNIPDNIAKTVIKIRTLINIVDNISTAVKEKDPIAVVKAGLYVVEEYFHFASKDFKSILKNYENISSEGSTRLGYVYNDLFKENVYKKISGEYPGDFLSYAKMGDIDILIEASETYINGVYIKKEHVPQFKSELKKFVWNKCKSDFLLLGAPDTSMAGYNSAKFGILPDTNAEPLTSKKAKEVSAYLKTCIDLNINRNILFYGPPGTGKSSMVKSIVSDLGMKSVRITYDILLSQQISNIVFLLNTLGADILIIDDIDRCVSGEKLIDLIDSIKSNVKFVFATANVVDKINDALLRPGRFDEFYLIDKMDEFVIRNIFSKIIGDLDDDLYNKIKHLPIAYINELSCRMKLMPLEQAVASIDELIERAKKLSVSSDRNDDESSPDDDDE